MTIEVGKRYRDKVHGVVGTVTELSVDPEGALVRDNTGAFKFVPVNLARMTLDDQHVEARATPGEHDLIPKLHDKRWFDEERLEPADEN